MLLNYNQSNVTRVWEPIYPQSASKLAEWVQTLCCVLVLYTADNILYILNSYLPGEVFGCGLVLLDSISVFVASSE